MSQRSSARSCRDERLSGSRARPILFSPCEWTIWNGANPVKSSDAMNQDERSIVKNKRSFFGISSGSYFGSSGSEGGAPFAGKMWEHLRDDLGRLLLPGIRTNGHSVHHHNEQVFRHLLANEAKRSVRSGHLFNGLLVYLAGPEGVAMRMDSKVTSNLFSALSGVLRETDYIGWYRDNYIVGVVLSTLGDDSTRQVSCRIEQRFVGRLRGSFWVEEFSSLRCHFFQSQELQDIESVGLGFSSS